MSVMAGLLAIMLRLYANSALLSTAPKMTHILLRSMAVLRCTIERC
jgi:hypothetical protein